MFQVVGPSAESSWNRLASRTPVGFSARLRLDHASPGTIALNGTSATAAFQMSQKQIEATLPDYSVAVNPSYAQEAAK